MENPTHGNDRPETWQMPLVRQLAQLDRSQPRASINAGWVWTPRASGCKELQSLRCDHPRGIHPALRAHHCSLSVSGLPAAVFVREQRTSRR